MKPSTLVKKSILAATALMVTSSLYADCTYQLFSITSAKGTKVGEFVDQISDECSYTVLVSDPQTENALKKTLNKTKIKNLTIHEVLELILTENNLAYELNNNILRISYIQTKTYNVDYIISQRKAEGTTDILLSSQTGSTTTGDNQNNSQGNEGKAEAGINITSTDEVKFWDELDHELLAILNRPEDSYKAELPTINRNTGLITVSATYKQHSRLSEYLKEMQQKSKYQVLIDVNILSVTLKDSSQTGINWSKIYALQNFKLNTDMVSTDNVGTFSNGAIETLSPTGVVSGNFFELVGSADLSNLIMFLETQGDVRAVSNPKVLTLNNQSALISVGTEYFYQIVSTTDITTTGNPVIAQNVDINSIFAGVLLDITPEISHEGVITLKVNPSMSRTRDDVKSDNLTEPRQIPPDLDRQQMASVITVKDNARVVLGGLIYTKNNNEINKVPLLGDIPILGYLFKSEEMVKTTEELVIVIQPHIIKISDNDISLLDLGYTGMSETILTGPVAPAIAIKEAPVYDTNASHDASK